MTSNVTPFDRGQAKIKALLSRKSFNGGINYAKALATLAAAARSLVHETTLKRVAFGIIHVTEIDTSDLNSTRLRPGSSFFVPRRGKPWYEANRFLIPQVGQSTLIDSSAADGPRTRTCTWVMFCYHTVVCESVSHEVGHTYGLLLV